LISVVYFIVGAWLEFWNVDTDPRYLVAICSRPY